MELFLTSCLKNSIFVLSRSFRIFHFFVFSFPQVFVSSCFHLFLFSFPRVFVSSNVFFINYICVVTGSARRERFLLSVTFYLTLPPAFIKTSLGPAFQPSKLQSSPLRFEIQTQPICLFE